MKHWISLFLSCVIASIAIAEPPRVGRPCSISAMTKNADVIVIATVEGVGQAPGFWSGQIAATQQVAYSPDQWLKGTLQTSSEKINTFTLEHLVVSGPATANKNEPRLNPALFAKGNKLILFLHSHAVHLPDRSTKLATDVVSADGAVIEATLRLVVFSGSSSRAGPFWDEVRAPSPTWSILHRPQTAARLQEWQPAGEAHRGRNPSLARGKENHEDQHERQAQRQFPRSEGIHQGRGRQDDQ